MLGCFRLCPPPQGARNPGKGAPPSRFLRPRPHPALGCPGQPAHFLLRWGLHPRTCWAGARTDRAGWTDSGQPPANSPFWRFWSRSRFGPNPARPWGAGSGGSGGEPQPGGQAADPALLPPSVARRKPWLVALGAVLALLFLVFALTVVYALGYSESRDRWAPNPLRASPLCAPPSLSSAPAGAPLSTGPAHL